MEEQKKPEDFKLPFKIYRPVSTVWKDSGKRGRDEGEQEADPIYFECSQNCDGVNNSQSKAAEENRAQGVPQIRDHTFNLVKKIFMDIKVDTQLNKH